MRAAKLGANYARVAVLPRVFVSGSFSGDDLTPLEEVYAPAIVNLPGSIQHPLRAEFWDRLGEAEPAEKTAAAAWIGESVGDLVDANLDIAFDAEMIERKAHNCARICDYFKHLEHAEEFCRERGIEPPQETAVSTRRGRLLRCRDPRWWRRQLDKLYGRRAENGLRRAGVIRRGNQLYASDLAVAGRRQRVAINNRWVQERVVVSDSGTQCELWDVREASQANPALRRNELMTRIRGFSEVADAAEHVADFYTLTTPSRFHKMLASGHRNPTYGGATVRDAQGWLRGMWAKARAKLKRLKVLIYGFRIAEPHHDGTPHWHMVLFCPSHHRGTVRDVLRGYWLSDGGSDPGAADHRITVKDIDKHKGTAAGYVAKYVAKNIDGFEVGADHEETGNDRIASEDARKAADASRTCDRVTTWATRHGIRQFQQIGGPAVTVWRELRRLRSVVNVEAIESARVHADSGEWCKFIEALGGIEKGRGTGVQLWSEITGEINQYDEMRGPQIVGVAAADGEVKTRTQVWRIVKKTPGLSLSDVLSSLGPVSITVRGGGGVGAPSAWSNPNETSMYGPN